MLKDLRAAFWISPPLPGLGRLPVNAMAVAGFLILGFGHAGFWLAGLALETAFLWAAAANPRFRALADAQEELRMRASLAADAPRTAASLSAEARGRLAALEEKAARALRLQRDAGAGEFALELNQDALDRLITAYGKLLSASETLRALCSRKAHEDLQEHLIRLEQELAGGALSPSLRDSKQATLDLLRQRLDAFERKELSLEEIESDLARIEAQVDLAIDRAGLRGKDATISADIAFVSRFLEASAPSASMPSSPPDTRLQNRDRVRRL